eukprot:SAG11_NODE_1590_length_4624_cov_3.572376_3_plen_60_part_00
MSNTPRTATIRTTADGAELFQLEKVDLFSTLAKFNGLEDKIRAHMVRWQLVHSIPSCVI